MIPVGKLKAELRKCVELKFRKQVQDQNLQGELISVREVGMSLNIEGCF